MLRPQINSVHLPLAVRDLQWAVSSPLLLRQAPQPNLFADIETAVFLKKIRSEPAPLLEYLADKDTKALGSYFEHLIIFWLSSLPSVSLIKSNLQIFQGKQTIGEIDVIFEHHKKIFHWEMAVKFYLNIASGQKTSHFVGPRLKDRLSAKLQHIFNHQIPLINAPETTKALASIEGKDVVSSAMVKGILFHPSTRQSTFLPQLPPVVSPNCRSGSWLTPSHLSKMESLDFDHFLILKKTLWFTDFYYHDEVSSGSLACFKIRANELMKSHNTPFMACLFRSTDNEIYTSENRIFIVPDNWPDLAAESHNS